MAGEAKGLSRDCFFSMPCVGAQLEHFIFDPKVRAGLPEVIHRQMLMIFDRMFGVALERSDKVQTRFNDDDLVAAVSLSQGDIKILLRVGFPRMLMTRLLEEVYGPVLSRHETTFEDAICEVANVLCNGVKKYLNESGFAFLMNIPKVDHHYTSRYEAGSDDHIELDFTYKGESFTVDLILFYKKDVLKDEAYI